MKKWMNSLIILTALLLFAASPAAVSAGFETQAEWSRSARTAVFKVSIDEIVLQSEDPDLDEAAEGDAVVFTTVLRNDSEVAVRYEARVEGAPKQLDVRVAEPEGELSENGGEKELRIEVTKAENPEDSEKTEDSEETSEGMYLAVSFVQVD